MSLSPSSSGVNTLSVSFPKSSSSQDSDLRVAGTPLCVYQSPDSGLASTPVSDTHAQHIYPPFTLLCPLSSHPHILHPNSPVSFYLLVVSLHLSSPSVLSSIFSLSLFCPQAIRSLFDCLSKKHKINFLPNPSCVPCSYLQMTLSYNTSLFKN